MAERFPSDGAAANGRRHLHEDEARLLFEAEYPVPPDMRVPGAWSITKAKELIRTTNLRLTDISQMVGYGDQSYFTKVFKRIVGISPKEYAQKPTDLL